MVEHLNTTSASPLEVPPLSKFVCGVDGSPESLRAVRQAALLAGPQGNLLLTSIVMPGLASSILSALPGSTAAALSAGRTAGEDAAARARTVAGPATVLVKTRIGPPAAILETEATQMEADAIAVGSHGKGRATGILLGSVATRLVHTAPCSVLVVRGQVEGPAHAEFPRSVAVGLDASSWSLAALDAASVLAERLGVPLRPLHVSDGTKVLESLPDDFDGDVEVIHQHVSTADGLCSRVTAADLLVIGSRGAHGLRALGSVSEAVAHSSPASVLIVRPARPAAAAACRGGNGEARG
jgi:nucleotide-binding universal stress UspA family protein